MASECLVALSWQDFSIAPDDSENDYGQQRKPTD
jgi:hypothetical protein